MRLWDYDIPKNWKPKDDAGWTWYLERKINYGDWKGLDPACIKRYFKKLRIDPGRRLMLNAYFKQYGAH